MILVFFVFSCQKWFDYEAHALIPFISHGPLIFWLYPVFGVRGAAYFLGSAELLFGLLLLLGFWNRKLAVLGSLGSCATYVATVTIIPFFPDAWAAPAGGFPAATLPFLFLMKDVVLLAASVYLLKQDILRAAAEMSPTQNGIVDRKRSRSRRLALKAQDHRRPVWRAMSCSATSARLLPMICGWGPTPRMSFPDRLMNAASQPAATAPSVSQAWQAIMQSCDGRAPSSFST
ncbi:DUF417 family protein [Bradyrhizobium sp. 1(2017)]|uniref:DUF417 family protein n=1 Tax=Bradyrhizobium sp. 1(2017) TaxID=1404888 RepID=UPI0039C892DA